MRNGKPNDMKRLLLLLAATVLAGQAFAQTQVIRVNTADEFLNAIGIELKSV